MQVISPVLNFSVYVIGQWVLQFGLCFESRVEGWCFGTKCLNGPSCFFGMRVVTQDSYSTLDWGLYLLTGIGRQEGHPACKKN